MPRDSLPVTPRCITAQVPLAARKRSCESWCDEFSCAHAGCFDCGTHTAHARNTLARAIHAHRAQPLKRFASADRTSHCNCPPLVCVAPVALRMSRHLLPSPTHRPRLATRARLPCQAPSVSGALQHAVATARRRHSTPSPQHAVACCRLATPCMACMPACDLWSPSSNLTVADRR